MEKMTTDKKCVRCGKPFESIPLRLIDLCDDCASDLEEFLSGAPIIKWNPVKVRPLTEEEKEELRDYGYRDYHIEEVTCLDGFVPEDGQEILISLKGSSGKRYVEGDTAICEWTDSWLDSGRDWKEVEAWAEYPEPYIPDEEEEESWKE